MLSSTALCARLDFHFGGFQRSAKVDAFRILAIRASHLISEPLATRNDKCFDQTFGKHSSSPIGLSRSSLNRNSSVASTNNRRSETGRRRREMDNQLFCYCLCGKVRWAAYLGALASSTSSTCFSSQYFGSLYIIRVYLCIFLIFTHIGIYTYIMHFSRGLIIVE